MGAEEGEMQAKKEKVSKEETLRKVYMNYELRTARCNSWKMKLLRHAEEPSTCGSTIYYVNVQMDLWQQSSLRALGLQGLDRLFIEVNILWIFFWFDVFFSKGTGSTDQTIEGPVNMQHAM